MRKAKSMEPHIPRAKLLNATPDDIAVFEKYFRGAGSVSMPRPATKTKARKLHKQLTGLTDRYDFNYDKIDGCLGIMAQPEGKPLLLAELSRRGQLSGGIYDTEAGCQLAFGVDLTVEELLEMIQD